MAESQEDSPVISIPNDDERYMIELEFVQSLSNMKYLHFLAQNKYFENKAFVRIHMIIVIINVLIVTRFLII